MDNYRFKNKEGRALLGRKPSPFPHNCNKSHALLPCFIIPYAQHLDVVREAAIVAICFNTHTIEELAELLGVDPVTVARWWRIFRTKAGVLTMALAEKLAHSPQLSDWVCGSFETWSDQAKKILELIGRCRATFSPDFAFCGFAWSISLTRIFYSTVRESPPVILMMSAPVNLSRLLRRSFLPARYRKNFGLYRHNSRCFRLPGFFSLLLLNPARTNKGL